MQVTKHGLQIWTAIQHHGPDQLGLRSNRPNHLGARGPADTAPPPARMICKFNPAGSASVSERVLSRMFRFFSSENGFYGR